MYQPTLFLDRDGVINVRTPADYVKTPEAFIFCPGALDAFAQLSAYFGRIVVVTNQAGIGKGLMQEADLALIHLKMTQAIQSAGGRIDAIYHCPNISADNAPCRKPNIGMAQQAKLDFPEIDFSHSWMVGDSASDMEFGFTLGAQTALINGKKEETVLLSTIPTNWRGNSLLEFAQWIQKLTNS